MDAIPDFQTLDLTTDPEATAPASERILILSDALFQMAAEPHRSPSECADLLQIQGALDWIEVDVRALEARVPAEAFQRRRTGLRAWIARFLLRFV